MSIVTQETQYIDSLKHILKHGVTKGDRTGTGTLSVFCQQLRFDLSKGEFPLFTSKEVTFHNIREEKNWMISGDTKVNDMVKAGCNIWNPWIKPTNQWDDVMKMRPLVRVDRVEDTPIELAVDGDDFEGFVKYAYRQAKKVRLEYSMEAGPDNPHQQRAANILINLWRSLFDQTIRAYFNQDEQYINNQYTVPSELDMYPLSSYGKRGNVLALCKRWQNPELFFVDFFKIPNHRPFMEECVLGTKLLLNTNYVLSGMYYNSTILSPKTAVFLHKREYALYKYADDAGVVKVPFHPQHYGSRPTMYVLNKTMIGESYVARPNEINHAKIEENVTLPGNKLLRFATSFGDLGPVYGKQWRRCLAVHENGQEIKEVDQLQEVIDRLKTNPDDRRLIIDSWNQSELSQMALPPCHYTMQFYTTEVDDQFVDEWSEEHVSVTDTVHARQLSLRVTMRSGDEAIGKPYNVAGYAYLLLKIASHLKYIPGELVIETTDSHIYLNQVEMIKKLVKRKLKPLPTYRFIEWGHEDLLKNDIAIDDYKPHKPIAMPVAV